MKTDIIVSVIIGLVLTLQDFWPLDETLNSPMRWTMLFVWVIAISAVVFGVMRLIRWWIDSGKRKKEERDAASQRSTSRGTPKPNRAQRRRMR